MRHLLLLCGHRSPPSLWHSWMSYRFNVIVIWFLWFLFCLVVILFQMFLISALHLCWFAALYMLTLHKLCFVLSSLKHFMRLLISIIVVVIYLGFNAWHKSGRCAVELYHAPRLWYPPFYTSPMASSALQHWTASPTKEGRHWQASGENRQTWQLANPAWYT